MADHHEFWLTTATAPPPDCVQIHCGGLGGGAFWADRMPKSGWGYRTNKGRAEDNPFLVVGAYRKEMKYESNPQMPHSPWTERAYVSRALDPSLGQSMSFPSLPTLTLRLEVPLWTDLSEARYPW